MKVSAVGRDRIAAREGRRLTAYRDSVGVVTIGVGHTGRMAPPAVHLGMTITMAECDAFLEADLVPVEKAINDLLVKNSVHLSQNQVDALASLIFNIGVAGFQRSTVARLINEGNVAAAADAFLLWEKPAALKARRESERAQFLRADAPSPTLPAATPAPAKPAPAPAAAAPAHPTAAPKAPTMTSTAASGSTALTPVHNIFADMIEGIETKIKDVASAITSGTATAAGASDKATAAIGSVPNGIDAAKHLATLVLHVRSGDFLNAGKDLEAIGGDLEAILKRFNITLPLLTEANSLLVKYVG